MNLLLLRGLAKDQRAWGEFPSRFHVHAPRMNLHFLDLPGVGTEYRRPSPSSVAAIRIEIAQRFQTLIAQGKLPKGPWSLMAISLGGMIGLDWAAAEPDLFEKMILLNTSTADIASPIERFRLGNLPTMLYSIIANHPESSERMLLRALSTRFAKRSAANDPKLKAIYEDHVKWSRERPITRTTVIRQLYSGAVYRLPDGRPKPKTILISSQGDRLVSPKCSTRLAEHLGVRCLTHPWAGHDISIDDPEWLARNVSDWMSGAPV
jgi:pimeloyl-ACP methyl ester carboxylesterase